MSTIYGILVTTHPIRGKNAYKDISNMVVGSWVDKSHEIVLLPQCEANTSKPSIQHANH